MRSMLEAEVYPAIQAVYIWDQYPRLNNSISSDAFSVSNFGNFTYACHILLIHLQGKRGLGWIDTSTYKRSP